MQITETIPYRAYLCLADVCGMLPDTELEPVEQFGPAIDQVFTSQYVTGVYGEQRWAFTSPTDRSSDLGARLYFYAVSGRYYLVHPPTRPENQTDNTTNSLTISGQGIPDKFQQAAQLINLVRPEFRDRIVVTGHSLGGGLAAYSALQATWGPPITIAFDPLGLNKDMMAGRGDLSPDFNNKVYWYYIIGSWVAGLNVDNGLSSVGTVRALPQDPARQAAGRDPHDLENVGYGLFVRGGH